MMIGIWRVALSVLRILQISRPDIRGNIRSSTISARRFRARLFQALRAIRGADRGEAACLAQLHHEQVDHVRFVLDDQDLLVRRDVHRQAKSRIGAAVCPGNFGMARIAFSGRN
jgi:hypothetical protein